MWENIAIKIAWLLPREVVYWCAVRVGTYALVGKYDTESPTNLLMMDALKRWDEAND
jgi:hypothetical protein